MADTVKQRCLRVETISTKMPNRMGICSSSSYLKMEIEHISKMWFQQTKAKRNVTINSVTPLASSGSSKHNHKSTEHTLSLFFSLKGGV